MLAATIDSRRRLTMPVECPAGSPVTVQPLGEDVWIVRVHRPERNYKLVVVPAVASIPDDPEMDAFAEAAAKHCARNLPPFEE